MQPIKRLNDDMLAIFLFHGVIEKNTYQIRNYNGKHMEKDTFFQILLHLKKMGHSLSMNEVMEHFHLGQPFPPRSFAITFDDGFENNYSIAAGILEDLNIPATFYITTDFIENNRMSWIDRIEYCLEKCPEGKLKLPWNEKQIRFSSVEARISILEEIRHCVKKDQTIDLDDFVDDIFRQCDYEPVYQSENVLDKKMTWKQVAEFSANSKFIIGGHTHTHRIMSFLDSEELQNEIDTSLQLLETKGMTIVQHYSYPEGLPHCYSEEVIEELKKRHILCCPTAIDGTNKLGDSLFHLKRIML